MLVWTGLIVRWLSEIIVTEQAKAWNFA